MARRTPGGAVPLVAGIATAAVLSVAAVFAVVNSGCDDPGTYRTHDGVVELVGGCLDRADLPSTPTRAHSPTGPNDAHAGAIPSVTP